MPFRVAPFFPAPESEPDQARAKGRPYYPMQSLEGLVFSKKNRQAPSSDVDDTPVQFRRYVDASGVRNVQIQNGLRNRIASGWRFTYPGSGYLSVIMPSIPGQARGNYGGFVPVGPSPYNMEDIFQAGPGSQPAHPGGPKKIAATQYINPMTG